MQIDSDHVSDVAVKGFTWAAAAGWSTFVVISAAIAGFIRVIGPARIYELWSNRDATLRASKKAEEASELDRVTKAEGNAAKARESAVYLSSAVALLIGVLEKLDPENPALKQARDLVAMASDNESAFGQALKRLAKVPDSPGGATA